MNWPAVLGLFAAIAVVTTICTLLAMMSRRGLG